MAFFRVKFSVFKVVRGKGGRGGGDCLSSLLCESSIQKQCAPKDGNFTQTNRGGTDGACAPGEFSNPRSAGGCLDSRFPTHFAESAKWIGHRAFLGGGRRTKTKAGPLRLRSGQAFDSLRFASVAQDDRVLFGRSGRSVDTKIRTTTHFRVSILWERPIHYRNDQANRDSSGDGGRGFERGGAGAGDWREHVPVFLFEPENVARAEG